MQKIINQKSECVLIENLQAQENVIVAKSKGVFVGSVVRIDGQHKLFLADGTIPLAAPNIYELYEQAIGAGYELYLLN